MIDPLLFVGALVVVILLMMAPSRYSEPRRARESIAKALTLSSQDRGTQ